MQSRAIFWVFVLRVAYFLRIFHMSWSTQKTEHSSQRRTSGHPRNRLVSPSFIWMCGAVRQHQKINPAQEIENVKVKKTIFVGSSAQFRTTVKPS
jgi:hypothetical protein